MKNTFRSSLPESDRSLIITKTFARDGITMEIANGGVKANLIIDKDEAPDIALAALVAMGPIGVPTHSYTTGTPEHLAILVSGFARYIAARDRAAERKAENLAKLEAEVAAAEAAKAAELADLAELEAEAVALYLAFYPDSTVTRITEFSPVIRARWTNTARHARELHAKP